MLGGQAPRLGQDRGPSAAVGTDSLSVLYFHAACARNSLGLLSINKNSNSKKLMSHLKKISLNQSMFIHWRITDCKLLLALGVMGP